MQLYLMKRRYIYLHVKVANEAAISFYKKNGFSMEQEVVDYYRIDGQNYNAIRFGKSLAPSGWSLKGLWGWVIGSSDDVSSDKKLLT